ncbi:sugar porter family MFS transporter [Novipirellula artificiosorum]|uniref:D-xylose-proton symporter n=1 Tax=Novipirellula artificiosorum TaxID=2528016 RepID=A0A5C6DNL2_9BACT|nr:sugar porter family MFS transporter [Novipirellula artificiosorum]TWU37251.1 D-xylose-proton symporter [Novipirellula artificiosorum]
MSEINPYEPADAKSKPTTDSGPLSDQYNMRFLGLICFVAAMGGLLFGYDWVVIGGAKPFYEPYFEISDSPLLQGWAMSSALVGCLVGAVVSGILADRLGRKRLLILSGFLFTLSAIGTALSSDFTWFNLFRLIGGGGIGLASNLSPMYIAEISPAATRGRFVSINQLTIVVGILAAQLVNMMIAQEVSDNATVEMIRQSWNGTDGWRWMFAAETVPAAAFFLLMFFVPESPRWLIKDGQNDRARGVLAKVGGEAYAKAEVDDIQQTLGQEEISQVHYSDLLESKVLKILALGVFLAVFQQWCGINVIFNYAQEIFAAAGYGVGAIMFNIVITGIVNLVFTFVAIFTVDKFGRRGLMLLGSGGLAIIYAILGASYYSETRGVFMLVLVVSAIACYAMSLAPVTWVVISEIFPNRIRGAAVAVSVFSLWLACTALTFSYPLLNQALGVHGTFWLYGAVCLLGFFVIFWKLPETKGKSLEQIEREIIS